MQQIQLPPLADGEIYIGACGNEKGNLHHSILLPGDNDGASWKAQMEWAKSIGGDLPDKIELAMLWNMHRDLFQKDWYWGNQAWELDHAYAWCQGFDLGTQGYGLKLIKLRARAVRRLPI